MDGLTCKDFSATLPPFILEQKVQQWLAEDVESFDFAGMVVGDTNDEAVVLCKSPGVLSGIPFVNAVFKAVGCTINWHCHEGQMLTVLVCIATVKGSTRNILLGERLALNILSRASGVSTLAHEAQGLANSAGWHGYIAGTRKTTPGFRIVEKYALLVGGIAQHRNNLSSMVMLKDNHIWATEGGVTKAVKVARTACGFSQKIEVECRSYEDACNAANAGADIVMLDNFDAQAAKSAAAKLKDSFPHLLIEISGGIRLETISQYFSDHIDILSMSILTQGYPCVDFSMKIKRDKHDPTNPLVTDSHIPNSN